MNNFFDRNFDFDDGTGGIGGNFTLRGGPGGTTQDSDIGRSAPVTIGGNALFDLGLGLDRIELGEGGDQLTIGGNITLVDVNDIDFDQATIGGSVFVRNFRENIDNEFETDDGGNFTLIAGDLFYQGGSGADSFQLEGTVLGNVFINLGSQSPTSVSPVRVVVNNTGAVLAGNVTVIGGNLGTEVFLMEAGTTINGTIALNLGGGTNDVDLLGVLTGQYFTYQGGAGADSLTINPEMGSSRMRLTLFTSAGNDVVELDTTNSIPTFGFIDFGAGNDTFTSMPGAIFPLFLWNL